MKENDSMSKQQNSHNNKIEYKKKIQNKLAQAYYKYNDNQKIQPNTSQIILQNKQNVNIHSSKQQLMTKLYPMEKKGKKFGTVQQRMFKISSQTIIQVDKNKQQRQLPFPTLILKQDIIHMGNVGEWGYADYSYRLYLQFKQRTGIYIYMHTKQEQISISLYLHSISYTNYRDVINTAYQKIYKQRIIRNFINKICKKASALNMREQKTRNIQQNQMQSYGMNSYGLETEQKKANSLNLLKNMFNENKIIRQLVHKWHEKAVMTVSNHSNFINVKNIVSQLSFSLQALKISNILSISEGQFKVWVGQVTHFKSIKFNNDQLSSPQFVKYETKQNKKLNIFQKLSIYDFNLLSNNDSKQNQVKIKNQSPPLSIWTVLQLQLQTKNSQHETKTWKSNKFYVIDLLKTATTGINKSIILYSGKQTAQLIFKLTSAKTQAIKVQIPAVLQQFPNSYTYKLSPHIYPILNQIIAPQILHKYIKTLNPSSMQLQYTVAYHQYLQQQSNQILSFHSFSKLYQILQIQGIIDKFYQAAPYSTYISNNKGQSLEHKATFIYQNLQRTAQKYAYYDAQKFIWQYPNQILRMRRLLSVIKAFDQYPRINYTQQFFNMCLVCMKIAQNQSLLKYKTEIFINTKIGTQSIAFFLILAIIKLASPLLLYHNNKNVLANNSLLFHYILKKHNPSLFNKLIVIQLNIEAIFGKYMVGMFAGLFINKIHDSNVSGLEIFVYIISQYARQKKQLVSKLVQVSSSTANINNDDAKHKQHIYQVRSSHNLSLVAIFLAILDLFDVVVSHHNHNSNTKAQQQQQNDQFADQVLGSSTAYNTAYSFLSYFNLFTSTQLQKYYKQLISIYEKYYSLCQQQLMIFNQNTNNKQQSSQYLKLQQNLSKFHTQNSPQTASSASSTNNTMYGGPTSQQPIVNSINDMNIGCLLQQIYSQFICYKQKNQADIRKICIVVDQVNLGNWFLPTSSPSAHNNANTSSNSYRPASLHIQLLQNFIKIYEHQYILPSSITPVTVSSASNSIKQSNGALVPASLEYNSIKHVIQLKLNRLQPIYMIFTYLCPLLAYSSSYCTILNLRQLPSNYYLQLTRQLVPVSLSYQNSNNNGSMSSSKLSQTVIQQKTHQLYSHRYANMQIFIKDSTQVQYLQNNVPNQYINTMLLADRLTNGNNRLLQQYRKDIVFCNQYFRAYRVIDNNFNLLYAKLGWYGNHYFVPADRLNTSSIMLTNNKMAVAAQLAKQQENNNNNAKQILQNNSVTLNQLSESLTDTSLKSMTIQQRIKIAQILFYTRCVYGRGLIPSILYLSGNSQADNSTQIMLQTIRSNKHAIKQLKQIRNQINEYQYNSCGSLLTYPLQNFSILNSKNTINIHNYLCTNNSGTSNQQNIISQFQYHQHSSSSFVDFYLRAVNQLPLIRYLTFRPLQFYLLEEIQIKLSVPQRLMVDKQSAIKSSPNTSTADKNIRTNISSPSTNIQKQKISNIGSKDAKMRSFSIILTNHPITNRLKNEGTGQVMPYKFITDIGCFKQKLFNQYEVQQNSKNVTKDNIGKLLYQKLVSFQQHFPSTMYFTYPQAIFYGKNIQKQNDMLIDGISVTLAKQMLIDQFLYLLTMNIYNYYGIYSNKLAKNADKMIEKIKKTSKINQTSNINSRVLDMKLQFVSPMMQNVPIGQLFQMASQTGMTLQIAALPIIPIRYIENSTQSMYNSSSNKHNISYIMPKVMNVLYRHYTSYSLINSMWVQVCILAKVVTPNYQLYYTQQKYNRRYRLVHSTDTVLGIEAKKMINLLPNFKFTDYQVLMAKDCVRRQLSAII